MTKIHEFPHMFATLGKPRNEIPYENHEEQRVGKKTQSPKTHENHEISHMFATLGKPRVEIPYENHEEQRVSKKSYSPKTL